MPPNDPAANLPAWAVSLPTHLIPGIHEGRSAILYRHTNGVFWDSGCAECQTRTAAVQLMPNHEAMSSCRSGGHDHCTCDSCF